MAETPRCRSCAAELAWATSTTGALIPLDAKPTPDGNLAVHRNARGDLQARVLKKGEEPAAHEVRGTSHFSSCPRADEHRRRR